MFFEISNLDFFLGKTRILRSISLSVEEREIVGLLGRNGAGKSSILRSVMGLYIQQAGSITFKGADITRSATRRRVMRGLAYAPEDSRVFPELSVEENINLGMWVSEKRTDVDEPFTLARAFEIFPKLQELAERKGGNLSGGEKKMVSITRALALNPDLLLLDESFEGLAPLVVKHFMDAMRRIRDMGISIMLAESNLRNASKVIHRAYVVERGEIIFQGLPNEIAQNEQLSKIVGR